jgi:hypothetical protein
VGSAELGPELWEPIAAALREGPQSLGRLRSLTADRNPNAAELLTVLAGAGFVLPVLRDVGPSETTQRFNRTVAETYWREGRRGGQYAMASPVSAAGVACTWMELAVACQIGDAGPEWPDPTTIATRILPDISGEALEAATGMVEELLSERPAVWRRFGII